MARPSKRLGMRWDSAERRNGDDRLSQLSAVRSQTPPAAPPGQQAEQAETANQHGIGFRFRNDGDGDVIDHRVQAVIGVGDDHLCEMVPVENYQRGRSGGRVNICGVNKRRAGIALKRVSPL